MLYVGRNYTSQVSGSTIKGVVCENCGCEYIYKMARTAQGVGSSPYFIDNDGAQRRAQQAAANALIKALNGVENVPCPDCGCYQQIMIARQREKYSWLLYTGIAGIIGMLITLAIDLEPFLYATALTTLVLGLWWILRRTFDPNTVAESRVGKPQKGVPEAVLRSLLEPKLPDLEEGSRETLERVFAQIDAEKKKNAGKFKKPLQDPQAQARAEAERSGRRKFQLGMLSLTTVVALIAITPVVHWRAEEEAYRKAVLFRTSTIDKDRYLTAYPDGKHAQEVADLRDDLMYENAELGSKQAKTPASLRAYLNDPRNKRHREEARQLCRAIYQEVVDKFAKLPHTPEYDADFAAGLQAALWSQADAENPTITVSVTSRYDTDTDSQELRDAEAASKASLYQANPKLRSMIVADPKCDRIIPCGDLFGKDCERKRESIIVQRLQALLDLATGARVVTVVAVPKAEQGKAAEPAMVSIEYVVSPAGGLNTYTAATKTPLKTGTKLLPALSETTAPPPVEKLKGFLRLYRVDLSISFKVQNFQQKDAVKVVGLPIEELRYSGPVSYGDWGIYAAMLHSASYHAFQHIAKKLGLAEPAIPNKFSPDGPA